MENNENGLNKLRMENEIKKMKLSLEHGATFFSPSENNLPPELEALWLNHIQHFEGSYANSKRVMIYDFVGNPTYKPANEIPEAEIEIELNRVLNLLGQKGIAIDTICEVNDRELYRFITEELFFEETNDMMIEGMTWNYIYEEFHPNHEYDIKRLCKEFVEVLLDKNRILDPSFMDIADEINTKAGSIKKEHAVKKMDEFRDAFSSFKLQDFNITSLEIAEETAAVSFDVNYTGSIEGGNEKKGWSGIGNFALKKEYGYWSISQINIPGVPL